MAPSLADADVLLSTDGVSLPATFLLARGQLTRTRVIYACMFVDNSAVVGKLEDFMVRMHKEENMLLYYMPRDATMRPHVPSLLVHRVQIQFANWLDKQWSYRYLVPPPISINCGFILS